MVLLILWPWAYLLQLQSGLAWVMFSLPWQKATPSLPISPPVLTSLLKDSWACTGSPHVSMGSSAPPLHQPVGPGVDQRSPPHEEQLKRTQDNVGFAQLWLMGIDEMLQDPSFRLA